MKIPFFHSLKYRIAFIVFILEVILLSFVLSLTLSFIENRAAEDMLERRQVYFDLVKSITQDSLFAGEFEDLQTFIDKINKDKEIQTIVAVNNNGTVIANTDFGQVGSTFIEETYHLEGQWIHKSMEGLGKIYIKFSDKILNEHIAAAQNLGITIAISGICIIASIGLLFGFLLTRRLRKLTVAINNFQHHNQEMDVDVSGQDEIALLGQSFHFMRSEIDGYINKLEHERELLEERVDQRTKDLNNAKEQLVRTNQELKILSITDRLTGISNRAFLEDALSREILKSQRGQYAFGVILMDIDHFKLVNDNFGHDVGDDVIKLVADIIKKTVRKVDLIGRWGGEEYLIICPNTDKNSVEEIATRIHRSIQFYQFPSTGRITASLGIAMHVSGDNENTIIKRADMALYRAKNSGRNCIKIQQNIEPRVLDTAIKDL